MVEDASIPQLWTMCRTTGTLDFLLQLAIGRRGVSHNQCQIKDPLGISKWSLTLFA